MIMIKYHFLVCEIGLLICYPTYLAYICQRILVDVKLLIHAVSSL